jgi:diaminopimelate decarboxylase
MEYVEKIDDVAVTDLVRDFGSPLFVISEKRLRENIRELKAAFAAHYQPVIHAWSYKTNYLNAVCAALHQEGSWAEVVSDFEYEKARALGIPPQRILFNGPHKPRAVLERCVAEGARIHLDNFDELQLLAAIAKEMNKPTAVTLRINFETAYTKVWTRFGFNLTNGDALTAAKQIQASSHLRLAGLHSHIGTFILEPKAYQAQIETMIVFLNQVEQQTSAVIDSLDIGGGFASKNLIQTVYQRTEKNAPDFAEFAQVICPPLVQLAKQREKEGKPHLTLFLETGRAIVDDAEVLISSVVANKRLPDGRNSYVLDAGVNLLFTGLWYEHQVKPTRALSGTAEPTVLYGPLCMNIDVIRQEIELPPLTLGDSLVISPAGAYNNSQWMQFIQHRPNVVMVHENAAVSVVRRVENLADLNAFESIPAHLRGGFVD